MTINQFVELACSLSVQAALLVAVAGLLSRFVRNGAAESKLWCGCTVAILVLVVAGVFAPTGGRILLDGAEVAMTDPSDSQVVAVHVLAHESMHMSGVLMEFRAECAAMQRDARLAMLLGATAPQAHRLARHYWLVEYPTMPADYRDNGCGPQGALDEHLTDSPWTALGSSEGSPVANAPMAQLRHCLSDTGSPSSDCGAAHPAVVEDHLATTPVA